MWASIIEAAMGLAVNLFKKMFTTDPAVLKAQNDALKTELKNAEIKNTINNNIDAASPDKLNKLCGELDSSDK